MLATLGLLVLTLPLSATPVFAESAATVPSGFRDELVWSGLSAPTVVAFAPNGKVFVAQKNGKVNVYDSLTDATATQLVDLSSDVYNYWDRGLLGFTVDPAFPTRPYVYALYAYDHILGDAAAPPRWNDACPTPPGPTTDGCVASARLERLTVSGNSVTTRKVLITDWCQQFPSHSIGTVAFGPEGALYVSGGDGASFTAADWGQFGGSGGSPTPVNPCGDPANQGGALRSQDLRASGDATSLDGAVIRVDPDTGVAWPGNANAGNADANIARIIAYGLRNPFRFTIRPNGNVWVGDVGWETWEEINKITDPDAAPKNFGWPCYEGNGLLGSYSDASVGLSLCTSLASQSAPAYTYNHGANIAGGDGCTPGSSSVSGVAFLPASSGYPSSYDNGLFFTDYSRQCIWFAPDNGGNPDFGNISRFADLRRSSETDGGSVFLNVTPAGDLIYADYNRGEIRAVRYYPPNAPPSASFTATPSYGAVPLLVAFDAGASSDSNGDTLTYAWDLDGDGQFDDSTSKTPSRTYTQVGQVNVGLRVTDDGVPVETDEIFKTISPGAWAPILNWPTPSSTLTWKASDTIAFSATATDENGPIPASGFSWTLRHVHCPSNCHEHQIETIDGVRSGSVSAPAIPYPDYLRLYLTVTDSDGLSTTAFRNLMPKLPYTDVASSKFLGDIVWLHDNGFAAGCGGTKYCPDSKITRGAMATFLVKALALPATTKDYFSDDNGSIYEKNINRLAAAGITSGCGSKKYCPKDIVSRAQMASFLAKAFSLPSATKDYFTDDNSSIHEANINRLAKSSITHGCSATKYCPTSAVTRGQMAAFLHRALTSGAATAFAAASIPVTSDVAAPSDAASPSTADDDLTQDIPGSQPVEGNLDVVEPDPPVDQPIGP